MLLIPAIDLKDGQCVRLRQGRMDDTTVFSDDPVGVATRWVEAGARRLHLVDLDGAFAGQPRNAGVIERIAAAHPDIPIQVGGGIRHEDTVQTYPMPAFSTRSSAPRPLARHTSSMICVWSFRATSSSVSMRRTARSRSTVGPSSRIMT
jgi:hypothetical protein